MAVSSRFATGYTLDRGVTNSMLSDFVACSQRSEFQLDGWQKSGKISRALGFGTRFHKCLENYYGNYRGAGASIVDKLLNLWDLGVTDEIEILDTVKLRVVFNEYCDYYYTRDLTNTWLSLEEVFGVTFGKTLRRGKVDGIQIVNKKPWLFETKTSSRIDDQEQTARLCFAPQNMWYIIAMEKIMKTEFAGCIQNVVRNPGMRLGAKEDMPAYRDRLEDDIRRRPDFYFQRYEIIYARDRINEFKDQLRKKLTRFRHFVRKGGAYRNEQACYGRWKCEFVDACSAGAVAKDLVIPGYKRNRVLFEELLETEWNEQQ